MDTQSSQQGVPSQSHSPPAPLSLSQPLPQPLPLAQPQPLPTALTQPLPSSLSQPLAQPLNQPLSQALAVAVAASAAAAATSLSPPALRLEPHGTHESMLAFLQTWNPTEDWGMLFKGLTGNDLMRYSLEDFVAILGQATGRALHNKIAEQRAMLGLVDVISDTGSDRDHGAGELGEPVPRMTSGGASKRSRFVRGEEHQLKTAPTYTGVYRAGEWTATKQKYQKHVCTGGGCQLRVRTYCVCSPGQFWCAGCFYEQHLQQ